MIRYALDQNKSEKENKDFLHRQSILHREETIGFYKGNNIQKTMYYSNVGINDYFLVNYLKKLQGI